MLPAARPAATSPLNPAARGPMLLAGQTFRTQSPRASRDFQVMLGHPDTSEPIGCLAVLTRAADQETDELSLRLAAAGIPVLRIDSDRCPGTQLRWQIGGDLTIDGRAYHPHLLWSRYFHAASIQAGTGGPTASAYTRDQWCAWAQELTGALPGMLVNPQPVPGRLSQLAAARDAGLAIPASVVTSCPADAASALPGYGDVVVKSLGRHYLEPSPGALHGLFPVRVSRADLARRAEVEPAPVLIQEWVRAMHEYRVYIVGEQILTYSLDPHPATAPFTGAVHAREVPLPPQAAGPLRALARRWQLDVAAFDLLATTGGLIFLEANGDCDWLWCERAAGSTAVTSAVCELLLGRVQPADEPAPDGRASLA